MFNSSIKTPEGIPPINMVIWGFVLDLPLSSFSIVAGKTIRTYPNYLFGCFRTSRCAYHGDQALQNTHMLSQLETNAETNIPTSSALWGTWRARLQQRHPSKLRRYVLRLPKPAVTAGGLMAMMIWDLRLKYI